MSKELLLPDPTAQLASDHELPWLDWIRFLAAFMVVATHARGGTWVEWASLQDSSQSALTVLFFSVTRAGTEWVLVFFVLSGFLVGGRTIERVQKGTFDVTLYAIDRATRILVPLLPALAWSAFVAFWVAKSISVNDFLGNILGLQGVFVDSFAENYPLWSLSYEIWFYVLAGCLAAAASIRPTVRVAAVFGATVAFAIFTQLNAAFLFAWMIGAVTFSWRAKVKQSEYAIVGTIIVLVGGVISQLKTETISIEMNALLRFIPPIEVGYLLLSLGLAILFSVLAPLRPRSKFLVNFERWGSQLATFSYSLYLTHYPLLYLWDHYLQQKYNSISSEAILVYGAKILTSLVFAWAFYLAFERHTATLRQWARLAIRSRPGQ